MTQTALPDPAPSLLRSRTVMKRSSVQVTKVRYVGSLDEDTGVYGRVVSIDRRDAVAMGDPAEITMTLEPGDHLNVEPEPEPEAATVPEFTAPRYKHDLDADYAARRLALDAALRCVHPSEGSGSVVTVAERFYAFLTKD